MFRVCAKAILLLEARPGDGGPLLAKLYSNRAASRLMQHAPADSLADCRKALQVGVALSRRRRRCLQSPPFSGLRLCKA